EEALELLAVQPVECILLDLVLPGISGNETCKRIKAAPGLRDTPVIMLTALAERDAMIEGINAGADDYLAKSSETSVLKARLRAQIRRKQFEDENRLIREQLLRRELEAQEARAARELAEERAAYLASLELKNAELAVARDQALRESRVKSQFLASMSHELRTPLNAIIGFSELLEQGLPGPLNETQAEFVGHVLVSGRHLLHLINDVLDLSRIEAGKMEIAAEWTELRALAESVCGVVGPLALKQGVSFDRAIAADVAEVFVDPVKLKQILYNLLSNAIKFTQRGGSVRLTAERTARGVDVSVIDTGPGIRDEDMALLFAEFGRIERPGSQAAEGTGLGLPLTKRLVELHGGELSVVSTPGRGSRFTVSLPEVAR
ncbi:MAG TPA: ATP-binding protein, partial [Byssovorax sp.]